MKHKPFFSVVIPVYNKEKYIRRTLESVLKQTFTDFELILVLDPSTDKTEEVVRSFSDSRIVILKRDQPGPGGYAARNMGIRNASADWIAFQDADDYWYEDHLESMRNGIAKGASDLGVVCTGYITEVSGNLSSSLYSRHFKSDRYFSFEEFLLFKPINSINVAIRRQVMLDAGSFPEGKFNRGADHETWLRIMNISRKGYSVNKVTAVYNKNVTDGVIKSTRAATTDHAVLITVRAMLASEKDKNVCKALKTFSNNFVITGVKHGMKNGNLKTEDVQALYEEVYPHRLRLKMYRIFSHFPSAVQRLLARLLPRFKF